MHNHLINQTSPYLLQHAENPVDWYPWCEEAFERAKKEDKPIFLSIGYSTCHWCHVMAHESFEDEQVAALLNRYFISIKVDKEERPDIDSIYMSVCQAFTGSGGWPTTVFLTPEQKPFFAGTYFPKNARYGQTGLIDLLLAVADKWKSARRELLEGAEEMVTFLKKESSLYNNAGKAAAEDNFTDSSALLLTTAVKLYKRSFDSKYGGFGGAPKFPAAHNLLFLMRYYEKGKDEAALQIVEKTLLQMYRGGIFDHIGGGFARYSTDPYFLVPHFEKMLYDNGLLILTYCKAYQITGKSIYRDIAEKTGAYVLREMTAPEGGFYCAQDADSEGVEGKYYLFEPSEIIDLLGEKDGRAFNEYFDITEKGNFEGKNIPNLLQNEAFQNNLRNARESLTVGIQAVYEYRKSRYTLHLDDKILTSWNGLMTAAMCYLYRVTGSKAYLEAAVKAQEFIQDKLCEKTNGHLQELLYVSYRDGKRGGRGFLDDYAYEIFALLALYEATLDKHYLEQAKKFCERAIADFYDKEQGGFSLYGEENEQLILRPKETYDGAMPSGNSVMAYNLVRLQYLTEEQFEGGSMQRQQDFRGMAERQLRFIAAQASHYSAGYAMFLFALADYLDSPDKITIVLGKKPGAGEDISEETTLEETTVESGTFSCRIPLDTIIKVLESPTKEYSLKDNKTTFYICRGQACLPPVNEL